MPQSASAVYCARDSAHVRPPGSGAPARVSTCPAYAINQHAQTEPTLVDTFWARSPCSQDVLRHHGSIAGDPVAHNADTERMSSRRSLQRTYTRCQPMVASYWYRFETQLLLQRSREADLQCTCPEADVHNRDAATQAAAVCRNGMWSRFENVKQGLAAFAKTSIVGHIYFFTLGTHRTVSCTAHCGFSST